MININYDNDANIIFNNLFTEANKKLRLREHMDSRKNFKERMFDLFLAVLVNSAQHLKNSDHPFCFFDVGAAEGAYSYATVAKLKKADIFCFEPDLPRLMVLEDTLKNTLEKKENSENFNINIYQNLVSNKSDDVVELRYYECEETHGGAGSSTVIKKDRPDRKSVDIPYKTVCLDDFVDKCKLVDIIKIDVEGAELLVLKGAIKFLNKFKPIMLLEIHGQDRFGNVKLRDVGQILEKCNLNFFT